MSTDDRLLHRGVPEVGSAGCETAGRADSLVSEHHSSVYRYAYRLAGCRSVAEDIAQEVFLRGLRALDQLRQPEAARAWLLTITRHEFAKYCKAAARKRGWEAEVAQSTAGHVSDREDMETLDWVQRALMDLTPESREILLMYYFEEFSYSEIAEALGIPIGTVMSRLSRSKSHLKRCLQHLAVPH